MTRVGCAVDLDGSAQPLEHLAGDRVRVARPREVGQQHDELVATEPPDGVARPHRPGEPVRDLSQHRVAGGVSVLVVHGLEPVEVDEQQTGAAARMAAEARERTFGPVAHERRIGEVGERDHAALDGALARGARRARGRCRLGRPRRPVRLDEPGVVRAVTVRVDPAREEEPTMRSLVMIGASNAPCRPAARSKRRPCRLALSSRSGAARRDAAPQRSRGCR